MLSFMTWHLDTIHIATDLTWLLAIVSVNICMIVALMRSPQWCQALVNLNVQIDGLLDFIVLRWK